MRREIQGKPEGELPKAEMCTDVYCGSRQKGRGVKEKSEFDMMRQEGS